jgi:tyrosine-protein phosphatase SIW14
VAVLRHVTGWNIESVLEEYRGYAEPKVRDCDVKYIMEYQVSTLQGLFADHAHRPEDTVLTGPRMARMLIFTAMIMIIMLTSALFW